MVRRRQSQRARRQRLRKLVKQGDLPGGGRFGLRKIITQHPELPRNVPDVTFEAKSVLAAGPRVIECLASVGEVSLNAQ